jgi:hypothetical protein
MKGRKSLFPAEREIKGGADVESTNQHHKLTVSGMRVAVSIFYQRIEDSESSDPLFRLSPLSLCTSLGRSYASQYVNVVISKERLRVGFASVPQGNVAGLHRSPTTSSGTGIPFPSTTAIHRPFPSRIGST